MTIAATIYRSILLIAHSTLFALLAFLVMKAGFVISLPAGLTLGAYALGAALAALSFSSKNERLARYCVIASGVLLLVLLAPAAFELLTIIGQSD